jgi:hypothetical protein
VEANEQPRCASPRKEEAIFCLDLRKKFFEENLSAAG